VVYLKPYAVGIADAEAGYAVPKVEENGMS